MPFIPSEVLSQVLDEVQDDRDTLLSFSKASRHFGAVAFRFLYRTVSVPNNHRLAKLQAIIERIPAISNWVERINLCIYPSRTTQDPHAEEQEYWDVSGVGKCINGLSRPNLSVGLFIGSCNFTAGLNAFLAISPLLAAVASKLTTLKLSGLRDIPDILFYSCTNLAALSLTSCSIAGDAMSPNLLAFEPIFCRNVSATHIETLCFDNVEGNTMDYLLHLWSQPESPINATAIRKFQVTAVSIPSLQSARKVIETCECTLNDLVVDVSMISRRCIESFWSYITQPATGFAYQFLANTQATALDLIDLTRLVNLEKLSVSIALWDGRSDSGEGKWLLDSLSRLSMQNNALRDLHVEVATCIPKSFESEWIIDSQAVIASAMEAVDLAAARWGTWTELLEGGGFAKLEGYSVKVTMRPFIEDVGVIVSQVS